MVADRALSISGRENCNTGTAIWGALVRGSGCAWQNPVVATAQALGLRAHAPANRPNMVAVGTIVWLSSELMFFAGLCSRCI